MRALARNAHSGVVFSQRVLKQNRQIFSKKDGRLLKEVIKLNEILKPYIKIAENSTKDNNLVKNDNLNKLNTKVVDCN